MNIFTYYCFVNRVIIVSMNIETLDIDIDEIVKKIVSERKQQCLSHENLAKKAGVHRSTISLLENGKTSIGLKNFLKILIALDISASQIFLELENRSHEN